MSNLKQQNHIKRQYSRITLKIKVALIRLVFRKGVSFDSAIESLGLKKTTALSIIRRYKETGSLPMRKFKRPRKSKAQQSKIKLQEVESEEEVPEVHNGNDIANILPNAINNPLVYCPVDYRWIGFPLAFYQFP